MILLLHMLKFIESPSSEVLYTVPKIPSAEIFCTEKLWIRSLNTAFDNFFPKFSENFQTEKSPLSFVYFEFYEKRRFFRSRLVFTNIGFRSFWNKLISIEVIFEVEIHTQQILKPNEAQKRPVKRDNRAGAGLLKPMVYLSFLKSCGSPTKTLLQSFF